MIRSVFFLIRLLAAWAVVVALPLIVVFDTFWFLPDFVFVLVLVTVLTIAAVAGFSHIRRVRLIAGALNGTTLANRQRRQIEIPFEAGEAFDLLAAAIGELPGVENVRVARDSLQVRARLQRIDPYGGQPRISPDHWLRVVRNQIFATVTPVGDTAACC